MLTCDTGRFWERRLDPQGGLEDLDEGDCRNPEVLANIYVPNQSLDDSGDESFVTPEDFGCTLHEVE